MGDQGAEDLLLIQLERLQTLAWVVFDLKQTLFDVQRVFSELLSENKDTISEV